MASIRRRKRTGRDVWLVDFFDAAGVRRRLTAHTREAAEDLLAEKIRESRQAAPPSRDRDITMAAYAARWLEQIATSVQPKTLSSYQGILRLYLLPAFGAMKVRALHRAHIKRRC